MRFRTRKFVAGVVCSYPSPQDMFALRTAFDAFPRGGGAPDVFVSEYAVVPGGGHGNLIGARPGCR